MGKRDRKRKRVQKAAAVKREHDPRCPLHPANILMHAPHERKHYLCLCGRF